MGLALGAVTTPGTLARWQAQKALDVGIITTGDLSLDAEWKDEAPELGSLFPGESAEAQFEATINGKGNNLRWKLQVAHKVDPAFKEYVTFQAWVGECGASNQIQDSGYLGKDPKELVKTVKVCVRFALNSGAPSSLQGKSMDAKVVVTALQAG